MQMYIVILEPRLTMQCVFDGVFKNSAQTKTAEVLGADFYGFVLCMALYKLLKPLNLPERFWFELH